MAQNNNIIGYTVQGQPIYGFSPAPVQPTQRLMAPIPGQTQPVEAQPNSGEMTFVDGFIEAKSYRVAPGTNVVLWDSEAGSNKIYIKSTDTNGVPQKMRILRYEDITDEDTTEIKGSSLSADEINKLIEERFDEMFDRRFKNKKNRQNQYPKRDGGDVNE